MKQITAKMLAEKLLKNPDDIIVGMSEDDGRRAAWVDLKGMSKIKQRRVKSKDHDGDEFIEYIEAVKGKPEHNCIKLCF
jgi:hypothetical protein